ncbi:MAG TPA: hypothetical protein EYG86_01925 [Crocinitomicaceae bacterium]|nr:hypothetical protein [Crocinitomicaceae bacterium]
MLNFVRIITLLFIASSSIAQWQWTELDTMPFRTSNNAVCEAIVNGNEFVYSFGGIDTTKIYSGIHQRSFKYNVATDSWTEIASLPDASGKIANAASFVNGKIYILGGYHVLSNSSEISSNKVHIYNPTTDAFEADGASIPLAIDDHVQCVYKDSLIFVVTGWSNNGNKPDVQIYDPSNDSWQLGTFTPNNLSYTSFGTSGYILGDTLYYYGGADGGAFAARRYMRKGYINPLDPTDITWSLMANAPGLPSYRAACSGINNTIFWVGGSSVSYNFNGIAYNGSGGVAPSARILHFNNVSRQYSDEITQPYGVMDLRGIAKLSNNRWIICGGMDSTQTVSNRTFLLENQSVNLLENELDNFVVKTFVDKIIIESNEKSSAKLVNYSGRTLQEWKKAKKFKIDKTSFKSGVYVFIQEGRSVRIQL